MIRIKNGSYLIITAILFLHLSLINHHYTQAQSLPDSIILKNSEQRLTLLYQRLTESSQRLYNGSEYITYTRINDEHPYLLPDEVIGSLLYDNEWLDRVPMLFDISKERLLVFHFMLGIRYQLVNDLIGEFSIDSHRFIQIKNNTDSTLSKRRFYEVLYDGQTQALAVRKKELLREVNPTGVTVSFDETSLYYFRVNGKLLDASNKRAALNSLEDRKKDLKAFIRKNQLFKGNYEKSIVQLAEYYARLNNEIVKP